MVPLINAPSMAPTGEMAASYKTQACMSLFIKVAHDSLQLSSNTPEGWNRKLIPLDMSLSLKSFQTDFGSRTMGTTLNPARRNLKHWSFKGFTPQPLGCLPLFKGSCISLPSAHAGDGSLQCQVLKNGSAQMHTACGGLLTPPHLRPAPSILKKES